ncbi:MAG: flagellin, partial [Oscillospiraceae bacterium]
SLEGVAKAVETIELVKNAINMVSSTRADLGAAQNKIGFAIDFMGVNRQNLVDSSSRISDADMAEEAMKFAKLLILGESSKAALAQANVQPVQVLGIISKATEKPEQNVQNEPKPKPKPEFQPKEPIKQAPVKKPTFEPKQATKAENNHENSLDF